ncbi:hypothetical protein F4777DRAFT_21432 [Nemania sp. FL0916]|nr:hypothetical protein F4777DRAFT_21432 [Nemania sp. FL0916]
MPPDLITPGARYRLRSNPVVPTGNINEDVYNVIIYLLGVRDDTYQNQLAATNLQIIGRDVRDANNKQIRGNMPAQTKILEELDGVITLARRLVANFEISEPLGTSLDMDWVGQGLENVFGSDWGRSVPTDHGHGVRFTRHTKKEIFRRAMALARTGVKTRVSYMNRHMTYLDKLEGTSPQPGMPPLPYFSYSHNQWTAFNTYIHSGNIIEDSDLAEINGDFWQQGPNYMYDVGGYFRFMFQSVYELDHQTVHDMRDVMDRGTPEIRAFYSWIMEYMNHFSLWRDIVLVVLTQPQNVGSGKRYRWMGKVRQGWDSFLLYLRQLHDDVKNSGNYTMTQLAHRNLEHCVLGLTALVSSSKINNLPGALHHSIIRITSLSDFPYLPSTRRNLPTLTAALLNPNSIPPPPPRAGEPGGAGGPGGPMQPGGQQGIAGPGPANQGPANLDDSDPDDTARNDRPGGRGRDNQRNQPRGGPRGGPWRGPWRGPGGPGGGGGRRYSPSMQSWRRNNDGAGLIFDNSIPLIQTPPLIQATS